MNTPWILARPAAAAAVVEDLNRWRNFNSLTPIHFNQWNVGPSRTIHMITATIYPIAALMMSGDY